VLLRVPADPVRRVCRHLDLEGDGVVFDEPLLGIDHLVPGHVVAEAPVVLLGVEQVGNLPSEVLVLLVILDAKFGACLAAPGRGFRLSVALKEVSHALGGPVASGTSANLPRHDHDLPGQVPNERRGRENRLAQGGEVVDGEAEGGLRPGRVVRPLASRWTTTRTTLWPRCQCRTSAS